MEVWETQLTTFIASSNVPKLDTLRFTVMYAEYFLWFISALPHFSFTSPWNLPRWVTRLVCCVKTRARALTSSQHSRPVYAHSQSTCRITRCIVVVSLLCNTRKYIRIEPSPNRNIVCVFNVTSSTPQRSSFKLLVFQYVVLKIIWELRYSIRICDRHKQNSLSYSALYVYTVEFTPV